MTRIQIKNIIIGIAQEVLSNEGYNKLNFEYLDLIDDLGLDSIVFVALIVSIEEAFDIIIPDDRLLVEHFRTIELIENEVALIVSESDKL